MKPILTGLSALVLLAATAVSQRTPPPVETPRPTSRTPTPAVPSPKAKAPEVADPKVQDPAKVDPDGTAGTDDPAKVAKQAEIEAKIAKMRQMLREGKLVRSHVRVTVRLTNGNKLQGVVKDGRMIERVDGLHFVTAEAGARGAGIRVWYSNDTNSYIFLPYDRVERYWVGQRLSEEQVKNIESELIAREALARKRYQEMLAERAREQAEAQKDDGKQPAEDEAKPAKPDVVQAIDDAEQKRLMAIYTEFPPEQGWGPERKKQIEVRRITVGAYPDETSRRFLAVFDDWIKAKELAEKVAAGNDGGTPQPGTQPDSQPGGSQPSGSTPATPPASGTGK